jgi:DNA polymerase III alpha subunit
MAGMAERGITGETAEEIAHKLEAFADFGFPESHSVSFAYLVYSSSWIKYHYCAEFAAALLNAQPMGFYSPQSLVADARRHGVLHVTSTTAHQPQRERQRRERGGGQQWEGENRSTIHGFQLARDRLYPAASRSNLDSLS